MYRIRVLSEVIQWLTDDFVDFSQLYDTELLDMKDRFDMLSIVQDVVYLTFDKNQNDKKIVVPLSMREQIIKSAHS